jgi:hypothetical protein
MREILLILAFTFSGSLFASWEDMTHSLNEVSILDCKIMHKRYSSKTWRKLVALSDTHSEVDNRNFSYSRHLIDEFRRDRYLVFKMEVNAWDYELEDIETGEWKSHTRNGWTTITFKIEDRYFTTTTLIHSKSGGTRDLAKIDRTINDGVSKKSYRLVCGERP